MNQAIEKVDEYGEIQVIEAQPSSLASIQKSEIEAQLDAAHKYPRRVSICLEEARAMVSRSQEIAEQCFYTLPRKDKNGKPQNIMGPSIRLAEILVSAWGNIQYGSRPIDVQPGDRDCIAQGYAWDMQKNVRLAVESRRRITGKNGQRFSDDMVIVTQNAAGSIARRNAVFGVIPKAYVMEMYDLARSVAVGDQKAIGERRRQVIQRLIKMGATEDRILARVSRSDAEQITAEDLEILIGAGTSIKNGESTVEEQFPNTEEVSERPTLDTVSASLKTNAPPKDDATETLRKDTIEAAQELWGDNWSVVMRNTLRNDYNGASIQTCGADVLNKLLRDISADIDKRNNREPGQDERSTE